MESQNHAALPAQAALVAPLELYPTQGFLWETRHHRLE
jgi:hypothetical protein